MLIAAATGVGSFVFGAPFLSTSYDYFQIPFVGEVELATALLFDLGVFLTVVGTVLLALFQLSRVEARAVHDPVPEGPFDPRIPQPAMPRVVAPGRDQGA